MRYTLYCHDALKVGQVLLPSEAKIIQLGGIITS